MAKQSIIKIVEPLCEKLAQSMGLSLYEVSLDREPAGLYLRVYIDEEGGLSLDRCEQFHRALIPKVDHLDYDFLEVCSPGIDRPVRTDKDIARALGTRVTAHLYKALDGRRDFEGTLIRMDKDLVVIGEGDGEISLPRGQVAQVRMVPDLSALEDEDGEAVEILDLPAEGTDLSEGGPDTKQN